MPTTATLQSFMTKNNFQALGEDTTGKDLGRPRASGVGKDLGRPCASGITSPANLKESFESEVIENIGAPPGIEIKKRKQLMGPPAAFSPDSVTADIEYEVNRVRSVRGLTENQLKTHCNMQRMTQEFTKNVPVVSAPSFTTPGEKEKYFIFKDPDEDESKGVQLELCARLHWGATGT